MIARFLLKLRRRGSSPAFKIGVTFAGLSALTIACAADGSHGGTAGAEPVGKTSEALTATCGTFDFSDNQYAGSKINFASASEACDFNTGYAIEQVVTSPTEDGVYGSQVPASNGSIDYTDCPNQYVLEIDNAPDASNNVSVSVWIPTVGDPTTCANTQVSFALIQNGTNVAFAVPLTSGVWRVDSSFPLLTGCYFGDGPNADQLLEGWPSGVTGTVRLVAAAQQITGTSKGQPVWSDVPVTIQLDGQCPDR